jgi:DnaJ homolog subfamily C member 28
MNLDVVARVAEGKIQEGIEEGKFDNLPGKGKPVVIEEDSSTPQHLRIANRVLKNAGVAPEWIQIRQDILEERNAVCALFARLQRESSARRDRITSPDPHDAYFLRCVEWHQRSRAEYLQRLKSVNTSILKYCMSAPQTAEPFSPYNIEKEMKRYDEEIAPPRVALEAPVTGPKPGGLLRLAALSKYRKQRGPAE